MTAGLTPITGDSLPSQCIVMDTEINHNRSIGDPQGTYYGDLVRGIRWRYEDGRKVRHSEAASLGLVGWWDWVAKQCRKGTVTWLFAYDLLRQLRCNGFLELLARKSWLLTSSDDTDGKTSTKSWEGFAVLADPPTIMICRAPMRRGIIKMVDLRNYGVGERKDMGGNGDWLYNAERWVCDVIDWIRINRLGCLQCTAGSQALHSYRRRFLDGPIACHWDTAAYDVESSSFYGGRCEVFHFGGNVSPIYHLDVNSLYPAACQNLDLPVELLAMKGPNEWQDPLSLPPGTGMISEVRLKTDRPIYPYRRNGLVIYPTGEFATCLAGQELLDACTFGHVLRFGRQCLYRCEPILHDYMAWLYSERLNAKKRGDRATEHLIKRMLVGLPGKFIQQDRRWVADRTRKANKPWQLWREIDTEKHEVISYRTFGWQTQREEIGGFVKTAIPAIGAWITSAARVHMRDFFDAIPQGHLFYTDTDSVWTDEIGYRELELEGMIHPEQLGLLKVVDMHKEVEFRGIKHYVADGRVVRAGVPIPTARDVACRPVLPAIRHVDHDLALGQQPQPLDTVVRADQWPAYRHGVVGEDGWVKPFVIGGK